MAVITNIYGKGNVIQYAGCVLNTWERNGSWDSDFYATVWDEEQGAVRDVEYDTTRCGGGGSADIDATDDVLRKVYRYYFNSAREHFDKYANAEKAKTYGKGDDVCVIKGRKIKAGTVGKCFWRGTCYNRYSRTNEDRMGIDVNGERFFIAAENCVNANWEQNMLTGKQRKSEIRNRAVNNMPHWARKRFGGSAFCGGGFFAV